MSHGERTASTPLANVLARNTVAIALDVFSARDTLVPVHVPRRIEHSDTKAITAWREGGPVPKDMDGSTLEFEQWLANSAERVKALSENERRLRTTMWAQSELAKSPAHKGYADILARFHREHWRIAAVSGDMAERETQIKSIIGWKARGG